MSLLHITARPNGLRLLDPARACPTRPGDRRGAAAGDGPWGPQGDPASDAASGAVFGAAGGAPLDTPPGSAFGAPAAPRPPDRPRALQRGGRAAGGVISALERVPRGAPVVILIHGYRFSPEAAPHDPHWLLYGAAPPERRSRAAPCADWPAELGFARVDPSAGLCIGFAWDARAGHLASLLSEGRNGFARVYDRAAEAGGRLGDLIAALHAARPDLRFDLFAHSLGARVALTALSAPGVGRAILLGAAEHASVARAAMPDPRPGGPEVYNVISRQNDLFDALFERFAPRPEGAPRGALGRRGLGVRRPDWIDLQLDSPATESWLADRGAPLGAAGAPICHWSFYLRPRAMELYRSILRDRAAWSAEALRANGLPERLCPRWARIGARLRPAFGVPQGLPEGAADRFADGLGDGLADGGRPLGA